MQEQNELKNTNLFVNQLIHIFIRKEFNLYYLKFKILSFNNTKKFGWVEFIFTYYFQEEIFLFSFDLILLLKINFRQKVDKRHWHFNNFFNIVIYYYSFNTK